MNKILNITFLTFQQIISAYIIWIFADILNVLPTTYYINIEKISPFLKMWNEGIFRFIFYLFEIFCLILLLFGGFFLVNSVIYVRYHKKMNIFLLKIILLALSYFMIKGIYIDLLQIYTWNELLRIEISIFLFLFSLYFFKFEQK